MGKNQNIGTKSAFTPKNNIGKELVRYSNHNLSLNKRFAPNIN